MRDADALAVLLVVGVLAAVLLLAARGHASARLGLYFEHRHGRRRLGVYLERETPPPGE